MLSILFAYQIHIVALAPKLAISVRKLHISPFLKYYRRTLSFQSPHKPRSAHFGRYGYENMYMVRTYFSFQYFYAFSLAQFSQYLSYLFSMLFVKYFSVILCTKYDTEQNNRAIYPTIKIPPAVIQANDAICETRAFSFHRVYLKTRKARSNTRRIIPAIAAIHINMGYFTVTTLPHGSYMVYAPPLNNS